VLIGIYGPQSLYDTVSFQRLQERKLSDYFPTS
jgi:hypothetical protein